ncbi:hypothetical protein CC86DRAFT_134991 [Ophiobolus disseminans]|uniref:Uncharacterized protein n=1 Tax=Ophiobolus disseminans TaxID=1469910 RepID=A0A6A7ACR5_9PLEO|nr:hypothetical protein CC86DRAFT_134991 [Ophiobolus disseminans]
MTSPHLSAHMMLLRMRTKLFPCSADHYSPLILFSCSPATASHKVIAYIYCRLPVTFTEFWKSSAAVLIATDTQ